jgi:hypothetical protein
MPTETMKPITFADTGIGQSQEQEERKALQPGMTIIIHRVEIRTSRKFGEYAVYDGENLDGDTGMFFSMSQVLTSQAKELKERYACDEKGSLKAPVLATVTSVKSDGGRFYLSFA